MGLVMYREMQFLTDVGYLIKGILNYLSTSIFLFSRDSLEYKAPPSQYSSNKTFEYK